MIDEMGIFRTTIAIAPWHDHDRRCELTDVKVDTGAEYSWIPRALPAPSLRRSLASPDQTSRTSSRSGSRAPLLLMVWSFHPERNGARVWSRLTCEPEDPDTRRAGA